jgi:hypothetical protein
MPGWMREGINPSPTPEPYTLILDYFRIKLPFILAIHPKGRSDKKYFPGNGLGPNRPDQRSFQTPSKPMRT